MASTFNGSAARRLAVVVLGLAAVAALCLASMSQAAKAPFKALYIMPMSGVLAGVGKTESAGIRAATTIVNRQGGILGSKVEVTIKDDAGDGAKSTSTALQEINATSYNLVYCGVTLAQILPCAAAIDKTKPLKIPGGQDLAFNKMSRTFGVGPLYDPVEEGLVRQLIRRKIKRVALMAGDNASGQTCSASFRAAINRHRRDISLTRSILVPITTSDATPYVQQAQAGDAQAFAICAFTPANLPFLRARKKLGVNTPVYADWLFASGSLNALTADERAGVFTQVWPWMVKGSKATRTKSFRNFAREFDKEIAGPTPLAITAAVTAANALYISRAAARLAKSTNPDKMVRVMSRITKASQVPEFHGNSVLYSKRSKNPRGNPAKDWTFVRAGTTGTDGYITPDS